MGCQARANCVPDADRAPSGILKFLGTHNWPYKKRKHIRSVDFQSNRYSNVIVNSGFETLS